VKASSLAAALPLAILSSTAWAQLPAGAEFRVNSYVTSGQSHGSVTFDDNGDFVVVWSSFGQDGSVDGVFGRRFRASGAGKGSEFRVNTYTTSAQGFASVASDANGNFVVIWQSTGQDGSGYGVFGQRYDAAGTPRGGEFRVNSYTTSDQRRPRVSSDANGNFVVVWGSYGQDGSYSGVFGRRFNAAGGALGAEFRVNAYTTSDQSTVAVASDPNGNFVVVWQSGQDTPSGTTWGIFGQRFDAAGTPQGSEFLVNSYTSESQERPSVAADADGNFVVVWSGYLQDGSSGGAFGQRFDASGARRGGEFRVNSYTTGSQFLPAVSSSAHGSFVVIWRSYKQDGSEYGIFGQRFDASGAVQGGEFRVNTFTTGSQRYSAVASNPDGDFVVVWDGYHDSGTLGVFGQRYGDIIFQDGFLSGDLSRWSSASTDGSDLSVSGAAALAGTVLGLQAFVNDTNSLFVQDDTPNAESRYRARFYFDTNGFDPGETQSHFRTRILIANGSGFRVITIVLKRQLGAYSVEARVRRNDGTRADTGFLPISDGPHFIEFDWRRATGPGTSNGALQLWIDGGSVAILSGIDNDVVPVDQTRMGALAIKTGAAGTLFFDQFESRRDRLIGPE
jgi:hypothetical protein